MDGRKGTKCCRIMQNVQLSNNGDKLEKCKTEMMRKISNVEHCDSVHSDQGPFVEWEEARHLKGVCRGHTQKSLVLLFIVSKSLYDLACLDAIYW